MGRMEAMDLAHSLLSATHDAGSFGDDMGVTCIRAMEEIEHG